MISPPLLKTGLKLNWFLFIIFLVILVMYMAIMVSMYDPDDTEALHSYLSTLPEALVEAMGFGLMATELTEFIALYYYGFIALLFPMIYSIILANRLVAALVEKNIMAYLLSTPNSRVKIVTTQAFFIASSIIVMLLINTAVGVLCSENMFAGHLHLGAFLKLNLATILVNLATASISFFFSCLFNDTKNSLIFGAGLPLFFFIVNMLRSVSEKAGWLKYLTIYTFFDAGQIIGKEATLALPALVFILITLFFFGGGIAVFSRKNLYI